MASDFDNLTKEELIPIILDSQEKMEKAAMYGNDLLSQLSSLKTEQQKMAACLTSQEQTVHELRGQLEVKTATEASWREEVEATRLEIMKVRKENEESRGEVRRLENQTKHMNISEQLKTENVELETDAIRCQYEQQIAALQSEVDAMRDCRKDTSSMNASDSFSSAAAAAAELSQIRHEKDEILTRYKESQSRERELISQLKESQSRFQEFKEVVKSKEERIEFLKDQLECLQGERASLAADLEAARAGGCGDGLRGNSLFSELEDRRVRAEKQLVVQQEKYRALEQRFLEKLREMQELKEDFVSRLAVGWSENRSAQDTLVQGLQARIEELERQLSALRVERERSQRRQEADLRQQIELESAFAVPAAPAVAPGPADPAAPDSGLPGARHYEAVLRAKEQQISELRNTVQQQDRDLDHLRESKRTALFNSVRLERELRESESMKMKLNFKLQGLQEEMNLHRSGESSLRTESSGGTKAPKSGPVLPRPKVVDSSLRKESSTSSTARKCIGSDSSRRQQISESLKLSLSDKDVTSVSDTSVAKKVPVLRTVNLDSPSKPETPGSVKNVSKPPVESNLSENQLQDENCKQM